MRPAIKSQLGDAIWKSVGPGRETLPERFLPVLDGGSLLQRFQNWKRGCTFENICQMYRKYVVEHYSEQTTIVFDGGYDKPSTKDTAHLRRTKGKRSQEVKFTKSMKLTKTREQFLFNRLNKQRFLEMLT